jgi:hypothetical protein
MSEMVVRLGQAYCCSDRICWGQWLGRRVLFDLVTMNVFSSELDDDRLVQPAHFFCACWGLLHLPASYNVRVLP